MKTNRLLTFTLLLISSSFACGYEVDTHREISRHAAEASNLASRLPDFGIDNLKSMFPSNTSLNSSGTDKVLYCINGFGSGQRSVLELIRLGAFCEDTTFGTGTIMRYLHHFYDPAHGGTGFIGFFSSLNLFRNF